MAEGGLPEVPLRHRRSRIRLPDNESLTAALTFLKPVLSRFKFKPSYVIPYLKDVAKETRMLIVNNERKMDFQRASSVLIDWLMPKANSGQPEALVDFLKALSADTEENLHLHNLICVSSVYLNVHRDLVNVLAQKVQDGTLPIHNLFCLLKPFNLLDEEQISDLSELAGSCGDNEKCVYWVTLFLACLYSKQAQIVSHILNINNAENAQDEDSLPTRNREVHSVEDVSPGSGTSSPQPAGKDLIQSSASLPGCSTDSGSSQSARNTGDDRHEDTTATNRSNHLVMTWHMQGQKGALWTELLLMALNEVAGQSNSWAHASLGHERNRMLWRDACDMVLSGIRRHRNPKQEEMDDDDDGADSDNSSSSSTETIRASASYTSSKLQHLEEKVLSENRLKEERIKKFVDSVKLYTNVTADPEEAELIPDDESLLSVETNSRQRTVARVITSGVLREEEINLLKSGPIQLRPYQDELLTAARQGHNALILLPTGTGKTYITLKYSEEHLKGNKDAKCVAFVVPKVRLAQQQYERFKAYLPEFKPYLKCGETSGSASNRQALKDVLQTSRIVVMTGQCLVEALDSCKVDMEQFSLLVLDECHHTRGGHPLRALMNKYMEIKYAQPNTRQGTGIAKLPQIIGLTASPGVGKARCKEEGEAVKYLKQLCARLDVSYICSVRNNIEDLRKFVHEPQPDIHECENRKVDKLKESLESFMEVVEGRMAADSDVERYLNQLRMRDNKLIRDRLLKKSLEIRKVDTEMESLESFTELVEDLNQMRMRGQRLSEDSLLKRLEPPVTQRGQDRYTQWLGEVEKALQSVDNPQAFYAITAHIDMLRLCQRCLILNEDCDSFGALELLTEDVDSLRNDKLNKKPVDQQLFDLFERHTRYVSNEKQCSLQEECLFKECENPKLKYLEELLLNATRNKETPKDQEQRQLEIRSDLKQQPPFPDSLDPSPHTAVKQLYFGDSDPSLDAEKEDVGEDGTGESEEASVTDVSERSDQESLTDSEFHHLDVNVRAMIFVRTLDLSRALQKWVKRHRKLKFLNPGRLTGVNSSSKSGGMTKSEVTEVMSKFNAGIHKVIICTSAAEEGLDFKACNLVIRYLYEASMVSMIQIRGRARDENSRYSVLGRHSAGCSTKEKENLASELAMREAVNTLQMEADKDPAALHNAIQNMQKEAWKNRWRKDVQEAKILREQLPEGVYKLLCRGCRTPACTSQNIRLLRKTNRVVIGAEFSSRYRAVTHNPSEGKSYDAKIPRKASFFCKECDFYWGIIVRHVDDGIEFPVIPIKRFIIEMSNGEVQTKEKWSAAFKVPEISDEDRQRHRDPLLDQMDLENDTDPGVEQASHQPTEPNNLGSLACPQDGQSTEEGLDEQSRVLEQANGQDSLLTPPESPAVEAKSNDESTTPKHTSNLGSSSDVPAAQAESASHSDTAKESNNGFAGPSN